MRWYAKIISLQVKEIPIIILLHFETIFSIYFLKSQEEALLKASIEADIKNAENKRKTMFEEIENAALQKRKEKENLINDLVSIIKSFKWT